MTLTTTPQVASCYLRRNLTKRYAWLQETLRRNYTACLITNAVVWCDATSRQVAWADATQNLLYLMMCADSYVDWTARALLVGERGAIAQQSFTSSLW